MKPGHFCFFILFGLITQSYFLKAQTKSSGQFPFQDPSLSLEDRAEDLLYRLSLKEKLALMQNSTKPVERLGIPQYNWWNECLHGVARDGLATVFPQAIALAAAWDPDLIYQVADVISTETRAKHHEHVRNGERGIYQGLTMWTPNINIFRDPRWGRGQETYGEDPFLTSCTGVAFVKGLQGNDPLWFKVIATVKHFAVHSGSEINRHVFDVQVSNQDLFDTYLPAFERLVKEGKVYSVMGAYNRVHGVPACASRFLLDTILRQKWGFDGYVVSDCGAIIDIYQNHKYAGSEAEASALAVKAGCDLTCGEEYIAMDKAVSEGIISETEIDVSAKRLLLALFRLGVFDNEDKVGWQKIPYSVNNAPQHDELAKKAALKSMVLLQNRGKFLPLSKSIKNLAIIGPYANDYEVLYGNYNGTPAAPVTFFQGIKSKTGSSVNILTNNYILRPEQKYSGQKNRDDSIALAVKACSAADIVIFCGGISATVEGEESPLEIKGFYHGDRTDITLPDEQLMALKALKAAGKKVVLVLTNGSSMAINWENENLDGIIETWYPGQQGGNALADILFGDYNPAGRLPVTFYRSVTDLPDFEDYRMDGRTYKYFQGRPLYPFGYGLSYTSFSYENKIAISRSPAAAGDSVTVTVNVKNTGSRDGEETVQLYALASGVKQFRPLKSLIGFKRVAVKAGETVTVAMSFNVDELRQYDDKRNDYIIYPGEYTLEAGASSSDIRVKGSLTVR